jgi:hypothetical protein
MKSIIILQMVVTEFLNWKQEHELIKKILQKKMQILKIKMQILILMKQMNILRDC